MGSRLERAVRIFEITAQDGSGNTLRQVRLYRNGEIFKAVEVDGNEISLSMDARSNDMTPAYYS